MKSFNRACFTDSKADELKGDALFLKDALFIHYLTGNQLNLHGNQFLSSEKVKEIRFNKPVTRHSLDKCHRLLTIDVQIRGSDWRIN